MNVGEWIAQNARHLSAAQVAGIERQIIDEEFTEEGVGLFFHALETCLVQTAVSAPK